MNHQSYQVQLLELLGIDIFIVFFTIEDTEAQALAARELVTVEYENVRKPILSLDEGIAAQSFFPKPGGDAKKGDAQGLISFTSR